MKSALLGRAPAGTHATVPHARNSSVGARMPRGVRLGPRSRLPKHSPGSTPAPCCNEGLVRGLKPFEATRVSDVKSCFGHLGARALTRVARFLTPRPHRRRGERKDRATPTLKRARCEHEIAPAALSVFRVQGRGLRDRRIFSFSHRALFRVGAARPRRDAHRRRPPKYKICGSYESFEV